MFRVQPPLDHHSGLAPLAEDRRDADKGAHAVDGAALFDHATAHGIGQLVVSTGDDRDVGGQAEFVCHAARNRADDGARRRDVRKFGAIQPGQGQDLLRPGFPVNVEEQGPVRQRVVHHGLCAEHEGDEATPEEKLVCPLVESRPMLLDPHQLRQPIMVAERVPVDPIETLVVQGAAQAFEIGFPSPIEVQDGRAEHLAILRHRHRRLAQGRHGQGPDRIRGGAGHDLADRPLRLRPHVNRVQLRPARLWPLDVVLFVRGREQTPLFGEEGHFAPRGAHVYSEQTHLAPSLRTCPLPLPCSLPQLWGRAGVGAGEGWGWGWVRATPPPAPCSPPNRRFPG